MCFGYSLEVAFQCDSNEYQQYWYMKNISTLEGKKNVCFFFFSGVMRIYANDEDSLYPSEYTEMLSDQGLCLCWSFTVHPDLCELPESIDIFFIIFQKKKICCGTH